MTADTEVETQESELPSAEERGRLSVYKSLIREFKKLDRHDTPFVNATCGIEGNIQSSALLGKVSKEKAAAVFEAQGVLLLAADNFRALAVDALEEIQRNLGLASDEIDGGEQ